MSRRNDAMVVAIAVNDAKMANWPKASGVNRRAVTIETHITTIWAIAVPSAAP